MCFGFQEITAGDKYEMKSAKLTKRYLTIKNIGMDDQTDYTCKVAKKQSVAPLHVYREFFVNFQA